MKYYVALYLRLFILFFMCGYYVFSVPPGNPVLETGSPM